jgi:alcohol dehydrogenase
MKALQLVKPLEYQYVTAPELPAIRADEARLRVRRVGICGSDYAGFLGTMPFYSYPRIPGHELCVEVLAVGSEAGRIRVGDRCSVEPYMNCGRCHACRKGRGNCCENLKVLGVMMDGGLTEEIVLPVAKLHPANALSPEQCALVETLCIGAHAVNRGSLRPSETALVVGAGPIGLSVITFAQLTGARTIVVDINPQRLEFVRANLGVTDAIPVDDHAVERLMAATGGAMADVVFDATGSNQAMSKALEYSAFGGRVVYVGITQKELSFRHAPILHRRELTLMGSRNALPEEFTRTIQLIADARIDTRPWITHLAEFDDAAEQIPNWAKPESRVIKGIIKL